MKYFYIDTNQYRNLYSESRGFSDDVHELICKLVDEGHGILLMPQQTIDEIERNRLRAWPEKQVKLAQSEIDKLEKKANGVRDGYGEYESSRILAEDIDRHTEELRNSLAAKEAVFIDDSSSENQKMQTLYAKAETLQETDTIYNRANKRYSKGNPPHDTKIGDHLIWESILERLAGEDAPELIFVANDGNAWGKTKPDDWLVREFRDKTSGNVTFLKRLSDIPGLTTEEQLKIKEAEQRAIINNTIDDFAQSNDYSSAGTNAQRLLLYKSLYDESDYARIIDAARTNYSIRNSWFTPSPLRSLLEDPENEGYVLAPVESLDQGEWLKFERKFKTRLRRQHDEDDASTSLSELPF